MDTYFQRVNNSNRGMEVETQVDQSNKPWIEKYRPNNLDQIIYQKETVEAFQGIKRTGKMPHLLLYGPPGTGKTSIILALAKELFGQKYYQDRILELNASDERGIITVREKIKKFAEIQLKRIPGDVPNFKIIILDEADQMTKEVQQALRRVIEDHSKITRFCLICNYITKISEALASRCIKFRFKPIPINSQFEKLNSIANQEKIKIDNKVVEQLIDYSDGDLRRSVNMLQLAQANFGDKTITVQDIKQISDVLPFDDFYQDLFKVYLKKQKISEKTEFIQDLKYQAITSSQVCQAAHQWIIKYENQNVTEDKKMDIILEICRCTEMIYQGVQDNIALFYLFEKIQSIFMSNQIYT